MTTQNTSQCCEGAIPEFPDSITVNQNILQIDSNEVAFRQEILSLSGNTIVLSATPFSLQNLKIYANGVLQRYGTDYTLNGKVVTFTETAPTSWTYTAVYLSLEGDGVTSGIASTGSIIGYAGGSPPTGWLLCDGSNVSRTGYADLFAVIGTTYGVGDGSTTFTLPDLEVSYYDGVTLVTNPAIIKT